MDLEEGEWVDYDEKVLCQLDNNAAALTRSYIDRHLSPWAFPTLSVSGQERRYAADQNARCCTLTRYRIDAR